MVSLLAVFAVSALACFASSDQVVHFPADYSIGTVSVVRSGKCQFQGKAQGDVRVPSGCRVRLQMERRHMKYFYDLKKLGSSAISELDLFRTDLDPEDLKVIASLSDLRSLNLKQNAGLQGHLKPILAMKNLVDLNLSSMGLHDVDLDGIEQAQKLRRLVLDMNPVTNVTIKKLAKCAALNRISLGKTKADGEGIKSLNQAKFVLASFSNLNVTGALSKFLCDNKCLVYVDLSACVMAPIDLESISSCLSLKTLQLASTSGVDDAFLSRLVALTKLEHLNISGTKTSDKSASVFAQLTPLRELNLSGTTIGDQTANGLARLPNLAVLNLGRTAITHLGVAKLCATGKLEVLDLSDTRITDSAAASLKKLVHLKELNLANTKISDMMAAALADLPNLKTLRMSSTDVSDSGLRALARSKSLLDLDVTLTRATMAGVASLRRDRPSCHVLHDYN